MAWVYLIVAGGLETLWATTMQLSEGFTKLGYSLLTLGVMAASVFLLAQATKSSLMGTAYAVDGDRRPGGRDCGHRFLQRAGQRRADLFRHPAAGGHRVG